jgi:hypothetical protein
MYNIKHLNAQQTKTIYSFTNTKKENIKHKCSYVVQ